MKSKTNRLNLNKCEQTGLEKLPLKATFVLFVDALRHRRRRVTEGNGGGRERRGAVRGRRGKDRGERVREGESPGGGKVRSGVSEGAAPPREIRRVQGATPSG